ncbi:MAG: hypothetical protein ACK2UH_04805, partial [Candidatus Promineifilaceae bacterium]
SQQESKESKDKKRQEPSLFHDYLHSGCRQSSLLRSFPAGATGPSTLFNSLHIMAVSLCASVATLCDFVRQCGLSAVDARSLA